MGLGSIDRPEVQHPVLRGDARAAAIRQEYVERLKTASTKLDDIESQLQNQVSGKARYSNALSPHDTPESRRNRANDPMDALRNQRKPRRYLCSKCRLPPHGPPPNCVCQGGSTDDDDDMLELEPDNNAASRPKQNAGKRGRRK